MRLLILIALISFPGCTAMYLGDGNTVNLDKDEGVVVVDSKTDTAEESKQIERD